MAAKMNSRDDLLADVAAFGVGDQAVEAEFGNDGCFVHIDAVFWNARLDPEGFVKLVVDNGTAILVCQKTPKMFSFARRDKVIGTMPDPKDKCSCEFLADVRVINIFCRAEDLKIGILFGKVLDKKISRISKSKKII